MGVLGGPRCCAVCRSVLQQQLNCDVKPWHSWEMLANHNKYDTSFFKFGPLSKQCSSALSSPLNHFRIHLVSYVRLDPSRGTFIHQHSCGLEELLAARNAACLSWREGLAGWGNGRWGWAVLTSCNSYQVYSGAAWRDKKFSRKSL